MNYLKINLTGLFLLVAGLTLFNSAAVNAEIVNLPGDQPQLQTIAYPSYLYECRLSPNRQYPWRVRACTGDTCGEWLSSTFTTGSAPELTYPFDPDWQGQEKSENPLPILKWCPKENAASYLLELYQEEKGTEPVLVLPERIIAPTAFYDDQIGWQELKTETHYLWQLFACPGTDTSKENCGPASQLWGILMGENLRKPTGLSPADNSAVNFNTLLYWRGDRYAAGYLIHIRGNGLDKEFPDIRASQMPLSDIWEEYLEFNTPYTWKVASCRGSESREKLVCEDTETGQIKWSSPQTILTTGAQPTNAQFEPTNDAGEVAFPLGVSWDEMPGAATYSSEIVGVEHYRGLLRQATTTLTYAPYFKQGGTYTVKIRTCADDIGRLCGEPAAIQFTVATLESPAVTQPLADQTQYIPSVPIMWGKVFGANAYRYQLRYLAADPKETAECKAGVGSIVDEVSPNVSGTLPVRCAGQYSLQVRGCIESSCTVEYGLGEWSNPINFSIEERPGATGGLIPCGQAANNPSTGWDDRKPCSIEHVFLLIKIIMDFLLFRMIPLFLGILAFYSGFTLYFGRLLGVAQPVASIKSFWKAFGIGLLITFFAWTFINIILGLLGFRVGIFGNWYEIPV